MNNLAKKQDDKDTVFVMAIGGCGRIETLTSLLTDRMTSRILWQS